ncbi:hypothetical protein ACFX11_026016 [Malus domestica]
MDENVHLRLEELLFTTPVGLVVVLCLVYVNFGIDLDLLNDLMGRNYITEQLPSEFYDTLKNKRSRKSVSLDVNVLAAALKMSCVLCNQFWGGEDWCSALDKPCDAGESYTIGEENCESSKHPESPQTDVVSVPSETGDSHIIG